MSGSGNAAGKLLLGCSIPFSRVVPSPHQTASEAIRRKCALETMIGIAALLVGAGLAWLCFAAGVYLFTRTGREGLRIARLEEAMQIERMEEKRRQQSSPDE